MENHAPLIGSLIRSDKEKLKRALSIDRIDRSEPCHGEELSLRNPYHPFYSESHPRVTCSLLVLTILLHVEHADTYIRLVFAAGYPPRACIEMCRRVPTKYDAGKERWDYLNTVVPRVSCDPPGGSRWSPLGSAGPPRTRPSRRVTYGGHPHVELPPSSLSRSRQKGPSNRLFEYRSIAFAFGMRAFHFQEIPIAITRDASPRVTVIARVLA